MRAKAILIVVVGFLAVLFVSEWMGSWDNPSVPAPTPEELEVLRADMLARRLRDTGTTLPNWQVDQERRAAATRPTTTPVIETE